MENICDLTDIYEESQTIKSLNRLLEICDSSDEDSDSDEFELLEDIPKTTPDIYNLLIDENRLKLKNENNKIESNIIHNLKSTTCIVECLLSNVKMNEEQFINELEPDERIIELKCNYGIKTYKFYEKPIIVKKSNKGRKPKPKLEKKRKKQGSGSEFNSQITFVIKSSCIPNKEYQIKLFRTGNIQIPGARIDLIDDVIECIKYITVKVNQSLKSNVEIIGLYLTLKNYKSKFNVEDESQLINIKKLAHLARSIPDISSIKYKPYSSVVTLKFPSPTIKKPKKKVTFIIFMSGKITISGSNNNELTLKYCNYISELFLNEVLIIYEGVKGDYPCRLSFDNIQ